MIDGGSVRSMANRTISVRSGTIDSHPHNQSNLVDFDVQQVSNKVQDQIERMFTDVIKDVTSCSFAVKCLGSLPLTEKVTSLLGLQEPLRQLYLSGAGHGVKLGFYSSQEMSLKRLHIFCRPTQQATWTFVLVVFG